MTQRRDELQQNLQAVHARIRRAAHTAGRDPDDVTLVVVTKTWPASDVVLLAELGVEHVGENRDQEAAQKYREVRDASAAGRELTWHFVGQLQTNKAKSVASYADIVQSVDRVRLVTALERGAVDRSTMLRCLVQVQLATESEASPAAGPVADPVAGPVAGDADGRGGAAGAEVVVIADAIAASPHLQLAGVMGVAPLGEDPATAFASLRDLAHGLSTKHPDAKIISAGMSGDLEAAVAEGATHVRIGSAVLGVRPAFG